MTIEMKSFAISTLDDIAEGFFHARISDLPESSGSVYGSCYEKQAGKADIKETATYRRLNGTE